MTSQKTEKKTSFIFNVKVTFLKTDMSVTDRLQLTHTGLMMHSG